MCLGSHSRNVEIFSSKTETSLTWTLFIRSANVSVSFRICECIFFASFLRWRPEQTSQMKTNLINEVICKSETCVGRSNTTIRTCELLHTCSVCMFYSREDFYNVQPNPQRKHSVFLYKNMFKMYIDCTLIKIKVLHKRNKIKRTLSECFLWEPICFFFGMPVKH